MVLTFPEILEYLRTLGERHTDVKTAVVSLPSQFNAPDASDYPAVLVECDPFCEETSPGTDLYSFAVQFLVRPVRSDAKANPALVGQAKQLADEYRQQLEDEGYLGRLTRTPTFTLMYGDADDGLSSGIRMEFGLTVCKMANRNTNKLKFTAR